MKNFLCVDLVVGGFDNLSVVSPGVEGGIESTSVVVIFRRLNFSGDNDMNSFVVFLDTSNLSELLSSEINFSVFSFQSVHIPDVS